ncbi:MAG: hypothetical protein ACLFU3_07060 [Dichotomicrobium sp.]
MSDQEPIPGSVFNPRQVRILKIVVIGLGVLLVIGFGLLVVGLAYQATKIGEERPATDAGEPAGQAAEQVTLPVPPGAKIERIAADRGRVILHVKGPDGEQVVIVDTGQGNAVTRLKLAPR